LSNGRRYASTIDSSRDTSYHCTILDDSDGPSFRIVSDDLPDKEVVCGTATGAWAVIANQIGHQTRWRPISGLEFFGLGQNMITHLIQGLPGADKLKDYVWKNFVEGG
jgi:hypothetical protein